MIEYIRGRIENLTPTGVVLETRGGVGYGLSISLNTYTALQGKEEARLYVYESIREDAWQLYGFATSVEREIFILLISVSGIGGQTARLILSAFSPGDLVRIVRQEDVRSLRSVKGIGPKAAARLIVDLQGKMDGIEAGAGSATSGHSTAAISPMMEEAVQALTVLGFSPAPTQKVVQAIILEEPDIKVERLIKLALKRL